MHAPQMRHVPVLIRRIVDIVEPLLQLPVPADLVGRDAGAQLGQLLAQRRIGVENAAGRDHLAEQRPMMGAFLDALGIQHENGLIKDDDVKPDQEKLGSAAAQIAQQFPPEHVSLYLNTLLCQDPDTWSALEGLPERTLAGV